jgi:serine/threonine protein kinase
MIGDRSKSGPVLPGVPLIAEHALVSPIASGAYGQVWLARSALGTYRAIKLVHRANFDHDRPFEREFAGIQKYEPISRSHEGLVDLLQVGRNDPEGYFYYVMELADDVENPKAEIRNPKEGRNPKSEYPAVADEIRALDFDAGSAQTYTPRTLASDIGRRGRLPLQECIQVGLSLSSALAYLHGQGLVHRDIKPSNVIFVDGVPKLADVGLVTSVGETRSYVGTEGFIAPEGPGTPQADLYSLGIVLYVMSTGKSHQDFPEPLSDLASEPNHAQWLEFNAVIHKACRAEVRERYQSAQQMHEELALLQRGQSVTQKRTLQRRLTLAKRIAMACMVIALLLTVLLSLRKSNHDHVPNPEARRLYELGRWHYNQLTPEDHGKALKYLTEAVQIDPKFIQPYGELAALYTWNILPEVSSTEQKRHQRTQEIADKALAINPNSAEGYAALSWTKFLERDWRGAETEVVRAIKLNPNLPIAHDMYSFYLTILERTVEARHEGQRAEQLEPPGSQRVTSIIATFPIMAERQHDEAIDHLRGVMELDKNFSYGHLHLAECYEAQSNYLAAIEEYRAYALMSGQDAARVASGYDALREAYESLGQTGYSQKWIELIKADQSLPDEKQIFAEMDLAGYYALLGDKETALDILEKHFDEPNVWQQIRFKWQYDSLRNETRHKALVKRAGLENLEK